MNQITIEFKNAKDLAKKINEYNEMLNPKQVEEVTVKVVEVPKQDVKPERFDEVANKVVEAVKKVEEPQPKPVEVKEKPAEAVAEVPVTNFEGEPVEVKAEEVEEPTENELDVETAEVDPHVYWTNFKNWLKDSGQEGAKAALDIFRKHGVSGKPSAEDLSQEIIEELDTLINK
ncbi:hypothetical protein NX757_07220 [Veillonella atypica]|nr:hypothetical protein NX757_07220 [Veillonella atypica]